VTPKRKSLNLNKIKTRTK